MDQYNKKDNEQFDIIIIGGGPGGYNAALRATQLGKKVCIVEKEKAGGICTTKGCIPTKSLLHFAEVYNLYSKAQNQRFFLEKITINYESIIQEVNNIITKNIWIIENMLKNSNISIKYGLGVIQSKTQVEISETEDKTTLKETISAKNIIIATGSTPFIPPWMPKHKNILTSDGFFEQSTLPKEVVILGGGYIGLEFATFLCAFGVKVTIIEMQQEILELEDKEFSVELRKLLEKRKINVISNATVKNVKIRYDQDENIDIEYTKENTAKKITTTKVILALGRIPKIDKVELEKIGIKYDKQGINTNNQLQTSIENIYAIGDVNGKIPLAHIAIREGIIAAENCANIKSKIEYNKIPRCIYTSPELAMIGSYTKINGKSLFRTNGKAISAQETDGFVKVYFKDDKLVGGCILGPRASDLITIIGSMLDKSYKEIEEIMFPHPTFAEAIEEAIRDSQGKSLIKNYKQEIS